MKSRSLTVVLLLVLVGVALVAAHGHHGDRGEGRHHGKDGKEHGEHHKHGCSDPVAEHYKRHVQCRQCVMGDDSKRSTHKWCAAAGATSDQQGQCVDVHTPCAASSTSITAVASCPSDAPATKHSCSLCTLDAFTWCQDELNWDDEYSGECVATSKTHRPAASAAASSASDGSDGSGNELNANAASFLPRVQGVDNLSDFSDFRGDEDSERAPRPARGGSDSDDSNGSDGSDGSDDSKGSDGSEGSDGSDGSDNKAGDAVTVENGALVSAAANCPAGKRPITKFASCSSAAAVKAANKRKHHKWVRRAVWIAIPLAIVVAVIVLRKRCKRRIVEWRARRAARYLNLQNDLAIVPAVAAAPAPAPAPGPMAVATAMPVAYPVQATTVAMPVAQPLLYSHNMGASAPAMYQPEGQAQAIEMRPLAAAPHDSLYPGMAVGGRGYARLGQDAV